MLRKVSAVFATSLAWLSLQTYAFAGAIGSGGTGGQGVGFVAPIQRLGNAMEILGGAAVAIAIFILVGQNLFHREDWGSLANKMVYVIIGGFVILSGGGFLSNLGVAATQGGLLP
jgi:hypothetical protein